MLVLTRKRDEQIYVTDPSTGMALVLTLVEMSGNRVKIGIDAPIDIKVKRGELLTEAEREKMDRDARFGQGCPKEERHSKYARSWRG